MMSNEGRAQTGAEGSAQLPHSIADEDAQIDGKHTRTALRNGDEVEKLFLLDPPVFLHHLGLDDGNHGISAAEGEEPDFKKCAKGKSVLRCHSG